MDAWFASRRSSSGLTPGCLEAVDAFYRRLVERTVPVSSTRVAELTKLLENTFRHVNIALVNELAVHARALGIDIWEAIDATAHQAVRLRGRSVPARASAATASRSIPRTCRGGSSASSA